MRRGDIKTMSSVAFSALSQNFREDANTVMLHADTYLYAYARNVATLNGLFV